MVFFRQLHKSAFWSQLLLGMVAILALPTISQSETDTPQNNYVQQSLTLSELVAFQPIDSEQAHFLFQPEFSFQQTVKQAVIFCQFLTGSYRLESTPNPPIRAGPVV